MTGISTFRKHASDVINWIIDYYKNIKAYPVKSVVKPREIFNQLPAKPPEHGEKFDTLLEDLNKIIIPGMTHWQHPDFFAYFPANTSFPSILGEMITAALGAQCMKWETSPAAAELEEMMMNWLKQMTGLPQAFHGVIQDTASTATLCAILTARESLSDFKINSEGYSGQQFRVYCSEEAHSSVEKAVKIAGIGSRNLIKIKTDAVFALIPEELEKAIKRDVESGLTPLCVVAALGTTGSTAVDPLEQISKITKKFGIWLHIDAAYAGSALILPEYRWMIKGIENADSFVFNPHKWLFINFDCSAYFVQSKEKLVHTFRLVPEYLKTSTDGEVNDYSDWGIQLGRRFRALKLWFVLRSFGIIGLQEKLRTHISLARFFADEITKTGSFKLMAPVNFGLVCFRYVPEGSMGKKELDELNERLLHEINDSGKIYLSHTRLNGEYTLRIQTNQTSVTHENVMEAIKLIEDAASGITANYE
ncbi:MAG: aspartate aminotransferase family protein [Bacteroidales bacterium]|nr:aspartate aminotransferase family protein [Bacteroidales bacterium]